MISKRYFFLSNLYHQHGAPARDPKTELQVPPSEPARHPSVRYFEKSYKSELEGTSDKFHIAGLFISPLYVKYRANTRDK